MTAKIDTPLEIYRLHIMLLKINPPIWRRIVVRSDSSIADLHYTLQIAFNGSDCHRALIRGTEDGTGGSTSLIRGSRSDRCAVTGIPSPFSFQE